MKQNNETRMQVLAVPTAVALMVLGAVAVEALPQSLRPQLRPDSLYRVIQPPVANTTVNARFHDWVKGFRRQALAQGISTYTFERAFRGVQYDAEVIERDRNQSEFTRTIWDYLASAVSENRVRNGQAALHQHDRVLDAIERRYGVDKEVLVAIWGLESTYGVFRGKRDVVQSLATLAFDGRRGAFFEAQLIAALRILQSGDISSRDMIGSWAGAMGHTQFIPTSYLTYAVDFTGDGRRDIWADDPVDALASTAAYLSRFAWVEGQPWGVEIRLPSGFDFALSDRKITKPPVEWNRLGVRGIDGKPVPNYGPGSILLPAGRQGVALMVFRNFFVIQRYNAADSYVIAAGHLSDRIKGGAPFIGEWPTEERALTLQERKELQQRLTYKGFDTKGADGKIGPNTMAAIRAYQTSERLPADGFASLGLLKQLR